MSIITAKNIYKSYGTVRALRGISFEVPKRSITGFLGPNGAGKTTTIGIMMQFIHQDRGSMHLFGMDVTENIVTIKRQVGLIADAALPGIRADKFLRHTAKYYGYAGQELKNRVMDLVQLIGGTSFYRRNTKTLSKGQKQRIMIANALIPDPLLIIADEPTAGLDPVSRQTLLKLFERLTSEEGKTIFFSNHVISEVEKIADHVIMLSRGKIAAQGELQRILQSLPVTNSYTLEVIGKSTEEIENLKGVEIVEKIGPNRFRVQTSEEGVETTPQFLKSLVNSTGVVVTHFSRSSLDLEGVFEEVTDNGQ